MKKAIRNLLWLSLVLAMPQVATAQDESDEIKIIPYSQLDPDIPHPAFRTARVTLKGIIRVNQLDVADNAAFRDEPIRFAIGADGEQAAQELRTEIERLRSSGELAEIIDRMRLE